MNFFPRNNDFGYYKCEMENAWYKLHLLVL